VKKKILVTGANGQLGSEIRNLAPGYSSFEFRFIDIEDLDITQDREVFCFFAHYPADYVINAAAYTAVDKAEQEPEVAQLVNAVAPEIIVRAAQEMNPEAKIFHISTDYVFDGQHYKPYLETDTTNPQGVYGKTKRNGELAIQNNEAVIIIRTSWLYSSFGHNFVKTVLRLEKEKEFLTIVSDQIGSPTYAGDLAKTLLDIIQKTEQTGEFYPGIYHYSNEGVASWYDFAKEILDIKNSIKKIIPISTEEYPTPARRPYYSVLSKKKIKTVWNIEIPHWKDSLKNCLKKIEI